MSAGTLVRACLLCGTFKYDLQALTDMTSKLSSSANRFSRLLNGRGYSYEIVELPGSTRTAKEAANAVGCTVPQIAKSLIFRGVETGDALLAIVSGSNQADTAKLSALCGESVKMADPDFVRSQTGFAIGGVPPTGHPKPLRTLIDGDLLEFDEIWAAAGTPRAVFCMPASQLMEVTDGKVEDITQ